MAIKITLPEGPETPHLKPRITVVGVGGAGGNAVNNMIDAELAGVDFVVANTDAQALCHSRTSRRIQLGTEATRGLGAGARPEVGRVAAEEAVEAIAGELQGANMVFITAGMGGGTGTGAAPVVASVARELGILTVGVVTKPFQFEGAHRMRLAEAGIDELAQFVDTLIIIPNQNLFRVANEKTTFADAFKLADDVLYSGVRSVTDLMINPGLINLDFADVRTVMQNMGRAMMGTGEAEGERRALEAAEAAIANPLLEDTSMRGARGVLINITGGTDVTLYEVDEAANRIRDEVESDAHIIFGSSLDPSLDGHIRVSVVATGINAEDVARLNGNDPGQAVRAVADPRPEARIVPEVKIARPAERSHAERIAAAVGAERAGLTAAKAALAGRPPLAGQPAAAYAAEGHDGAPAMVGKSAKAEKAVRLLESLVLEANAKKDAKAAIAGSAALARPELRPEPRPEPRPPVIAPRGALAPRLSRDTFIPSPAMEVNARGTAAMAAAQVPSYETRSSDRDVSRAGRLEAPEPEHEPARRPLMSREEEPIAAYRDDDLDPGEVYVDDVAYDPRPAREFRPALPEGARAAYQAQMRRATEDHPREEPRAPRVEKPSLLARITGLGGRSAGHEHRDGNPLLSAKTLSAQADDRPVASQPDDQLEIPAFLRRQAN